jgi:phosphoglucosamine mutase
MTRRLFGTDGVRGRANTEPMTAATALRLGMAAGQVFTRGEHRHSVVIGKDTRLSGYMIEPALTSGFVSMGMNVILVGPVPTPAIGMLTRSLRADLGVMISASHNPFHDNGIKLFGPDGYKLSDATEAEIEARMENGSAEALAAPADLGRARRLDDAPGRYIEFAKQSFPKGMTLDGLKVVLDCANGAAYRVAPTVLWELGADVETLGVEPDGFNINRDCGSTAPEAMCARVVECGADLGIALDGDADRLAMCDEAGKTIDGDQLLALIAGHLHGRGALQGGGVVATLMSNLGLERHLEAQGLHLARTQVGDRYVVEHMRANGYNFGGEQSGHLILTDHATTGDGLVAALQSLAVLKEAQAPASAAAHCFEPLPQVMQSLPCAGVAVLESGTVADAVQAAQSSLAGNGRLVVRLSGTEPKARVMAEGEDEAKVAAAVAQVAAAITEANR